MRGQISLDLILTLLVLGTLVQVLQGFAADAAQGQASASLNHQARETLQAAQELIEAGQAAEGGLSGAWQVPALVDPNTGKAVDCRVVAEGNTLRVVAGGKTLAEATLATPARADWACGQKMVWGAGA